MLAKTSYKNIKVNDTYYYGKHMIMTCEACSESLLDVGIMKKFLQDLADAIDMIRYGEPTVARFGEGIEEGLSGVQLITTSALTIHTNDQARDLYLDVFSCKWFDEQTVIDFVKNFFAPEDYTYQVILRK